MGYRRCIYAFAEAAAPGIGADSVEILKNLGYTDAQLKEMQATGAIAIG